MFVFIPNYQFALYCGFAVTELFLHVLKKQNSMYQKIPNYFLGFFQLPRLIKIRRKFQKNVGPKSRNLEKKVVSTKKKTTYLLLTNRFNVQCTDSIKVFIR